jgi:hypothetical protein
MSEALRTLLAEFVIQVDSAGELAKGNAAVDALRRKLEGLQAAAAPAARAVNSVFARAGANVGQFLQAQGASSLGGRSSEGGFAAAGAAAATRKANEAAIAYSQTLKGRWASAIASAKADLGKGGQGGGGFIASLFSLRNAFIAAGAGAALRGAVGLINHIGGIGEAAAKLGVSTDDFQRLGVLAAQNATSVEALGTAFRTLANGAVQPTKQSAAAFARLGVETRGAGGEFKTAQDLFFETAQVLADMPNELERTAIATDLYGRSALDLKPILAGGSEAIRNQRAELMKLRVLSKETIASADGLSDSWEALKLRLLTAAEPLIKLLIPALGALGKGLVAAAEWVSDFVKSGQAGRLAFVGLALGAARYLPLLRALISLGGGFIPILAKMSLGAKALGKSFLTTIAPLLILEDILGFFMGKDSLTGRGVEAAFGKDVFAGVKKTIEDLKEAFVDLWKWVFGDGAGAKTKAFFGELSQGVALLVNDLLATIPFSGRKAGLAGLEGHQAEAAAGGGLNPLTKLFGGVNAEDPFLKSLGQGFGAPAIAGGSGGAKVITDNRTINTQVTMGPSASPSAVGQAVSSAVGRTLEADLAATAQEE